MGRLCIFYEVVFGFTNLAPTIAARAIKTKTTAPPQIPAAVNEAPIPLNAISSFETTFWVHSS
jgi:hypothetical protein